MEGSPNPRALEALYIDALQIAQQMNRLTTDQQNQQMISSRTRLEPERDVRMQWWLGVNSITTNDVSAVERHWRARNRRLTVYIFALPFAVVVYWLITTFGDLLKSSTSPNQFLFELFALFPTNDQPSFMDWVWGLLFTALAIGFIARIVLNAASAGGYGSHYED